MMSFSDLFGTSHSRNLNHFASIVNIASVDGEINLEEKRVLKHLAQKLDISKEDYEIAIESPGEFPVFSPNSVEERLEHLYEIITVIFADYKMNKEEEFLLKKYAVALGFSSEDSQKYVRRSIEILSGHLSFDEYMDLLKRK